MQKRMQNKEINKYKCKQIYILYFKTKIKLYKIK